MGSLFQLRDFWYTSFPGEEFSPSAITLADLDAAMLFDKIVIGSFQGLLRILNPSPVQGPMLPGDVLLEKKYGEPILQLQCGPFRPFRAGAPQNTLAVLFPRTLLFLEIIAQGSDNAVSGEAADDDSPADATPSTPDGRQRRRHTLSGSSRDQPDAFSSLKDLGAFYTLTVVGEAHLQQIAYNFVSGCFGNCDYKMVCVQSMDGLLTIVDYSGVLYRTILPSNQFLIPGPMEYSVHRDALLTCNSSMFLLSYSFSSLVLSSTAEQGISAGAGATRPSSLRPQWAFNLGEDAVAIAVCRLTQGLPRNEADIVVLCTSLLYVLNESGEPRIIRRLDVDAASLCVYPLPGIHQDNLLVGTFNGLVQVYSDTELQWSAAVASGAAPLHLAVATLCGVEGMIVNLGANSTLSTNYLGTDPVEQRPQSLETKSASYADIVHDLKHAEDLIRQFIGIAADGDGDNVDADDNVFAALAGPSAAAKGKDKKKSSSAAATAEATVAAASPRAAATSSPPAAASLSVTSEFGAINAADNSAELVVTVQASATAAEDVTLVLQAVPPLLVAPSQCVFAHISAGGSAQARFTVGAVQDKDLIVPSSLEVTVEAVYRGLRREYETVEHVAVAPLPLVARPVAPVKNTAFVLQLNTEQTPPPSLTEIFSDMAALGNVATNVLSVRYLNGADATVLVSKNAARFKLQGSTMEGLWLLASELRRRVRLYYSSVEDLRFESPDELPVPDFVAVVDTHWAIRKEMVAASSALDDAAALFRAVEKRLLSRFRDRSPADASAIEVLFQESYKLLQERADAMTRAKTRLRQASAMLNGCARLLWLCLEMKCPPIAAPDAAVLAMLFRCSVTDDNEGGWEEVTEAVLAKVLDLKTKRVASNTLELPASTTNLKKQIAALVAAVQSGQRLTTP
ncbi:PTHB1 N-terminus/PTHB1 C-terminus [Novymonas esmeraldas]|uniref:PTHB1 N-terminus/PTHB1 C-terminus n=1 Tax=Novymonas esmeraldas TaxID=1808958 RepID=A0AAW0EZE4_9TRYP